MISFNVVRCRENGIITVSGVMEVEVKDNTELGGSFKPIGYFEGYLFPVSGFNYPAARELFYKLTDLTEKLFKMTFSNKTDGWIYAKTAEFLRNQWPEVSNPNYIALVAEVKMSERNYEGLGIEGRTVKEFCDVFLEDRENTLLAVAYEGELEEKFWLNLGYTKHPRGEFFYHCSDYVLSTSRAKVKS